MFPAVKPSAPWEASTLLTNTAIASGYTNTAKLDRLTFLESVVANLLIERDPAILSGQGPAPTRDAP